MTFGSLYNHILMFLCVGRLMVRANWRSGRQGSQRHNKYGVKRKRAEGGENECRNEHKNTHTRLTKMHINRHKKQTEREKERRGSTQEDSLVHSTYWASCVFLCVPTECIGMYPLLVCVNFHYIFFFFSPCIDNKKKKC